ncbi:hypothetical protein [Clostridium sp. 3-3]|uniref:hypothetical protein n=1 Tax=Clostridium sp. 3-3 TaxID=2070757 RepID=UPI000CDB077C|nr:hypothetical protein [Clostridium sp. 3-3]POO87868.1 hypothetical protein C1H59_03635 [Clostridium sp. 3-3]
MRQQQYVGSLEQAFDIYGRENLIPISFIKQQIFYAVHGVQPRFIWEKEDGSGKIVAWYLKYETDYVKKMWVENKPTK